MFKKYITLILFVSLFCISSEVNAQSGDCDGPPSPGGPPCPPKLPLDGGVGVTILLAAGVAYGLKKFREEK